MWVHAYKLTVTKVGVAQSSWERGVARRSRSLTSKWSVS